MKKKRFLILVPLGILLFISIAFLSYTGNYYHASEAALECMKGSDNVKVVIGSDEEIAFIPENIEAGVVFYPGGLVEYEAYAPLMLELAENDIMSVIVKMPFKLAMFNANGARNVIEKYTEVPVWYIGGHSLGGVFASRYASKHEDDFNGVLLLASYTTEDISDSKLEVISIYGTKDLVLNKENYEKSKTNLPSDYKEVIIEGGCHAFFGSYGAQKNDGEPAISQEEQTDIATEYICEMIKQ